ncbi:MAG: hypothetical protein PVI86_02080 [Phycisphaerae bacterium]|jgi:hypothetical protein
MPTRYRCWLLTALLITGAPVLGDPPEKDVWKPLRPLEGTWEGTGHGNSGNSELTTTFRFVLQGEYLESRTRSVFPPQEGNPKGETHEDWGIISYDRNRQKFVYRQFNVEGFVNQYVLETLSGYGTKLVFVTEKVENGPPGLGARLTYTLEGDDALHVTFELKWPGKDFDPCNENRLRRMSKP